MRCGTQNGKDINSLDSISSCFRIYQKCAKKVFVCVSNLGYMFGFGGKNLDIRPYLFCLMDTSCSKLSGVER